MVWLGWAGLGWCPLRSDTRFLLHHQPTSSPLKTHPAHLARTIQTHVSNSFFDPNVFLGCDFRGGGIFCPQTFSRCTRCILALGQISPRRGGSSGTTYPTLCGGNQFGNALLLLTHLTLLLLLHLLLLPPPSGFANPLTGSKSDSLGIQQIKICPSLPDQCLCLHSGLVWI